MIVGLEIVIGRAPAILGWAYALLVPTVDMPLAEYGVEQVSFKHDTWEVDQDYTEDNLGLHTLALRC